MGVAMLDCIVEGARETAFAVLAVCVMPDHWHALLMPLRSGNALGAVVRSAKGKAAARLRALSATGRIWQRQFYDHVVRADENLRQVAE
jgi:REP element-mobilizing transposase RayT